VRHLRRRWPSLALSQHTCVGTPSLSRFSGDRVGNASTGKIRSMPSGLKRYQQTGDFHFITFSCYRRQSLLEMPLAKRTFEQTLEQVRRWYGLFIAGYVVMPEHVHLLPDGGNGWGLHCASGFLGRAPAPPCRQKTATRMGHPNSVWLSKMTEMRKGGPPAIVQQCKPMSQKGDMGHPSLWCHGQTWAIRPENMEILPHSAGSGSGCDFKGCMGGSRYRDPSLR
jgi:hypothetical protein